MRQTLTCFCVFSRIHSMEHHLELEVRGKCHIWSLVYLDPLAIRVCATLNWSGARTGSTLCLTMLCLIMIYIYINVTYQYNNNISYMIQYSTHQYITISITRYEITCTYLYLYQMYDTIYKTKEIKIEITNQ